LLVEAHGGRIWAENGPAGGAMFHIDMPLAAAKAGYSAPRAVRVPRTAGQVDDPVVAQNLKQQRS